MIVSLPKPGRKRGNKKPELYPGGEDGYELGGGRMGNCYAEVSGLAG